MKAVILAIVLATVFCELLVTQEYIEAVRKRVDWEVVSYEDNIFRGWTTEDFRQILGTEPEHPAVTSRKVTIDKAKLPSEISWKGATCIHDIRNQGNCASSWAFTAASVVSDRCCLRKQDYGWLSPMELTSCDRENMGCIGGIAKYSLEYVMVNGLVPEACYPYTGRDDRCPTKCKDGTDWIKAHVCKPQEMVDCGTLDGMKSCLLKGPITLRMRVHKDFTIYKSGVYCWDQTSSSEGTLDIRGIGYSESPKPNFLCANSWGQNWGENGFFRISPAEGCGLYVTPFDSWSVSGF
jgi:hypothetical protein